MKIFERHSRFFLRSLICSVVGGFLFGACTEESTTYDGTIYSIYLAGTLTANAHDYAVKGSTLFYTLDGVTNLSSDKITYSWTISDTSQHELWGQTIKYKYPDTTISVSMSMLAGAYDTYPLSASKTTIIIDSTYEKTVKLPDNTPVSATFIDMRDNQTYQYRTINSHDWMTQNLNWAGSDSNLPIGKTYKGESEYGIFYGRLYSWKEVSNLATPVCPEGWHLPTNTEWENLGQALSGAAVSFESQWKNAGNNAAVDAKINGKILWPSDPDNRKANTEGWNALPAGQASGAGTSITYKDNGRYGYWWSATERTSTSAFYRYIASSNSSFYSNYGDKEGQYLSARCVRD